MVEFSEFHKAELQKAQENAARDAADFERNCSDLREFSQELAGLAGTLAEGGWALEERDQGFDLRNKRAEISATCFAPDGQYDVSHRFLGSSWSIKDFQITDLKSVKATVARLMVKYR